jgi:hypothetical protein
MNNALQKAEVALKKNIPANRFGEPEEMDGTSGS